jgi:short-subunit dehydrogenase
MGAAVAFAAVRRGYSVLLVSRTESKLQQVADSIRELHPGAQISVSATDILDPHSVRALDAALATDREVDFVQSAGLSAVSYEIADANPYRRVEDIPPNLPSLEFDVVVRGLLNVVQTFLPRWEQQSETRLVVVGSMSGIRAYPLGYAHASAKAGLHHAVRSLALELCKRRIYVSEVNPGAVNTGFYDGVEVQAAVRLISKEFGYDYTGKEFPQAPPLEIGELAVQCLIADAHVLTINAVAKGQFPHQGG